MYEGVRVRYSLIIVVKQRSEWNKEEGPLKARERTPRDERKERG